MWTRRSTAHDEFGTCVLPSEACPTSIPAWMLASLFEAVYRTLTAAAIQRVATTGASFIFSVVLYWNLVLNR
jgi:hypothetical protein